MTDNKDFIFKQSKIAPLCITIETVEGAFFVTGLETLQVLGVEMFRSGSTESNVRSFEAFLTIYLSIITRNLYLLKKPLKKPNNEIITPYLTGATVV
jgi:hypothetical protein